MTSDRREIGQRMGNQCQAIGSSHVAKIQERKISPKRKFWGWTCRGHPGVIRADVPAQNFSQGGQNPGKKKTSISARTSMTRRRGRPRPEGFSKNFGQKNFGLNCRSPKNLNVSSYLDFLLWVLYFLQLFNVISRKKSAGGSSRIAIPEVQTGKSRDAVFQDPDSTPSAEHLFR